MQFIKADWDTGAQELCGRLLGALRENKKVLWLLSGGSNIAIEIFIMQKLIGFEQNLTLILADERYGSVGHADSNWKQLELAGFKAGTATVVPVLESDLTLVQTAEQFSSKLQDCLAKSDIAIGQFGMGDDGHIAGILPEAAEKAMQSNVLAVGFKTKKFDRITMTFAVFYKLSSSFCFTYGESKRPQLELLKQQDLDLVSQPSQILKQLSEAYVYNDFIGDAI